MHGWMSNYQQGHPSSAAVMLRNVRLWDAFQGEVLVIDFVVAPSAGDRLV